MENIYYRIVKEAVGKETVFIPEQSHEQIKLVDGVFIEDLNPTVKVKEVCFAKTVEGCLFGINMFLEEGTYHIYKTDRIPTIDLSHSGIGDFPTIQEVRYQEPVPATYVGEIYVTNFLIHCLTGLYEEANKGKQFNHTFASKELVRFQEVNNEIIYSKEVG
ncbi:hypothetical protein CVD28_03600 [Bacillus sp. M6-12]|uniref:hypothetical protein n=1 Tax=Bacillus sp. M6-12 TaxID=2054166 RepID=UPI000C755C0A|nr:hypothetical protein [Bacillus sp. M6-12]PLS19513.1 hypothetical protein CVD28_03600 [Bacillus sp. M6-12]